MTCLSFPQLNQFPTRFKVLLVLWLCSAVTRAAFTLGSRCHSAQGHSEDKITAAYNL